MRILLRYGSTTGNKRKQYRVRKVLVSPHPMLKELRIRRDSARRPGPSSADRADGGQSMSRTSDISQRICDEICWFVIRSVPVARGTCELRWRRGCDDGAGYAAMNEDDGGPVSEEDPRRATMAAPRTPFDHLPGTHM